MDKPQPQLVTDPILEINSKQIFFIIFALLMGIGAHYFQLNPGGTGLKLPINNIVWIFFATLIGLGLWQITLQTKIFYTWFSIAFLITLLLFFIPLFYPNNHLIEQSYARLLALSAGFLLFIGLHQFQFTKRQTHSLLLLVVLAGCLEACYSLLQNYTSPNSIFSYIIKYYGAPFGAVQQVNALASFMATTIILSGYLVQKVDDKKIQVFLILSTILSTWVIALSVSRTGYFGALIAIILFVPWAWSQHKNRLIIFFVAIALGITLATFKGQPLKDKGEDFMYRYDHHRVYIYKHCWQMIQQKPLMGYGYGSFTKEFILQRAKANAKGEKSPFETHKRCNHPHNELMFWIVEGGIVAALAILLLIIAFFSLLRTTEITQALALLSLTVPITLHTQLELPFYHSTLHWFILIVLVFYISQLTESIQQKSFQYTFALRSFAVLIPLITTIFMVTNLYATAQVMQFERPKTGTSDIRLLLNIANPIVFNEGFEFHLNDYRLQAATQLKNREEIQNVIKRLNKLIQTNPYYNYFLLLTKAYIINGQPKQAYATLKYARYLYPEYKPLQRLEKNLFKKDLKHSKIPALTPAPQ